MSKLSLQFAQPLVFVAVGIYENERLVGIVCLRHYRVAIRVSFKFSDLPARCVQSDFHAANGCRGSISYDKKLPDKGVGKLSDQDPAVVESNAGGSLLEHTRGLGYYRRKRPFEIVQVSNTRYDVIDIVTRELLGVVYGDDKPGQSSYFVELGSVAAPADKVFEWNVDQLGLDEPQRSRWEVAELVWRYVFPKKSVAWCAMRNIVAWYDWVINSLAVVGRGALVVLAIVFALDLAFFAWEVRGIVHDIVLQWLESVRDQG
ncbi:MAG: hypothetical protein OXT64_10975 [Gammaproteobacteria bacterium]|nr:hypothetical protein [Gammaproteobacteria bacterium]